MFGIERDRANHIRKLISYWSQLAGKRVRVWTRFMEEPAVGKLIYMHVFTPFTLFIRTDDGQLLVFNWAEVVRVDVLDDVVLR